MKQKIEGGWVKEFRKRFVLDPAEVFFGNREELKKQGWEVGASKLIIKQDATPEELEHFISDLLASERQRCVEAIEDCYKVLDSNRRGVLSDEDELYNSALDQAKQNLEQMK